MIVPSRMYAYAFALVAFAAAFSSLYDADATHAPVWDPAMASAPPNAAGGTATDGSVVTLTLYNIRDAMYYMKLRVGSPPQSVRVSLDMAASDLAVLAIKYDGHMNFNDSKSSTFQPDGRPVKLRDRTTGVLARDRVELHEGTVVDAEYFTEINNVTALEPYYKDLRFDGWLGLAPRATQSVGDVPTILESLFASHAIEKPFIGISMPKGKNGHVSFGSFMSQVTEGAMTYIDQLQPRLWTFPVDKIEVGDKPIDVPPSRTSHTVGSTTLAALDNLESFLVGPPHVVEAIFKAVGAKPSGFADLWSVSCVAPMHNITFWIGQAPMTVTVDEMVGLQLSQNDCVFMMRSWDKHETPLADWAFGLPIFHRYDFGFSYGNIPRLGFALHPQK